MPQAVGLTAELKDALGGNAIDVKLTKSGGGAFEITVDGRLIFSKLKLDRFPAYQEIPTLIAMT